jgi:L-rhamnose mutarotase
MEYVSFMLKIDPADKEEYVRRHQAVYPELEQAFGEAGIRRYQIFYNEGTLFAHMEVNDFKKAMKQVAESPANVKWQQFMSDMLLSWEDGSKRKDIEEVYRYTKE